MLSRHRELLRSDLLRSCLRSLLVRVDLGDRFRDQSAHESCAEVFKESELVLYRRSWCFMVFHGARSRLNGEM